MNTKKILFAAMMAAVVFAGCTKDEDPDPFKPTPTPTPTPTPSDTLTVSTVLTKQDNTIALVKGYIVGWFNTKPNPGECVFTNQAVADTTLNQANVLIAETAAETDPTKVVCVQLPAGAVRSLVNLGTNPNNLGQQVIVKGNLTKYNLLPGIKTTTYAEINGKKSTDPQSELYCYHTKDGVVSGANLKIGDVVVVKTVLMNYKGTLETSYGYFTSINGAVPEEAITVARALEIAAALAQTTDPKQPVISDSVLVKGTVTKLDGTYSTEYKNISFYVKD